jgi:hypothetical protein
MPLRGFNQGSFRCFLRNVRHGFRFCRSHPDRSVSSLQIRGLDITNSSGSLFVVRTDRESATGDRQSGSSTKVGCQLVRRRNRSERGYLAGSRVRRLIARYSGKSDELADSSGWASRPCLESRLTSASLADSSPTIVSSQISQWSRCCETRQIFLREVRKKK